jgi:hypothetical protein
MNEPFIYKSPRTVINEPAAFDIEHGVTYRTVEGEHSIWAARVPFLPAMLSDDFTRLGRQRVALAMRRQYRFIHDLARVRENSATFELRFIATPNPIPDQPNLVDLVFLGKVFSARENTGKSLGRRLWEKFVNNFPLEDPFNYPLEPVTQEEDFFRYYEPIPFVALSRRNIFEIRKYEDMPVRSAAPLGRVERKGDYVAHPFVPNLDFSPMGRFLTALASQPQKCFAGISLRPTRMFDQEIHNVSFAIGTFKKQTHEDDDITEEYIRARSEIGASVYEHLMLHREQLTMVRVHVVGEREAPYGLAEALGSEMMGDAEDKYPTQWIIAQPADEREMLSALNNIRYLESDIWGHTIAPAQLQRLRYLATPEEALGGFRLPVAPESGYLPGLLVKSEPFVAPADELELRQRAQANQNDANATSESDKREKKISLGAIYHRGNATPQEFRVKVSDLTRHALIAGSTGSGKSTTIKHLLQQLWVKHQVPFLVLYPVDKPDYRELRGFHGLADDLLIFTLGDESTSPFRFNPFEVPDGILLKTHLSRLMRVFVAAFSLPDPLPMIYREALRQVYRQRGWDTVLERGGAQRDYPIMSEFHRAIREITDGLRYGREVQDNVRQMSVIRIADLLENAGHVVNVRRSMNLSAIMNRPTLMEIGRVGSMQDTALLMGFLLMRFAEEIERHPRPKDQPHITVVEEAHRLMAETNLVLSTTGDTRGAAGEDFSNILAEVRGYGEGIIIAEQIPTLLVKGAIGNTYLKTMHWLEDAPSFDLFSNVMNLNTQQREYTRALGPGFAIVRSQFGRPVHIKVPEFGDQDGFNRVAAEDIADERIRAEMEDKRRQAGLDDVPVVQWEVSLAAETKSAWRAPTNVLSWLLAAPMQTCALCKPLHEKGECLFRQTLHSRVLADESFRKACRAELEAVLGIEDLGVRWGKIRALGSQIHTRVKYSDLANQRGITFCYLAHEVDVLLRETRGGSADHPEQRKNLRSILQQFESRYAKPEQEVT